MLCVRWVVLGEWVVLACWVRFASCEGLRVVWVRLARVVPTCWALGAGCVLQCWAALSARRSWVGAVEGLRWEEGGGGCEVVGGGLSPAMGVAESEAVRPRE